MKFKFKLYETSKIKIFKVGNLSFFLIENFNFIFYFKITKNVQILKKKKNLLFSAIFSNFFSCFLLKKFFFFFFNFYKQLDRFYCKKILLKGLGFKVVSHVPGSFLELKIGYSHFVKIYFPKKDDLKLYINKNMLVIEGKSKSKVGNFANKIKKFRLPDIYKGKGIWYKNEVKIFKEIKKT